MDIRILFVSQASVIFIQENAAFNHVLTHQDWHNQLLNTINFILLLNFKESFLYNLNLGEKVADFSERSSRRFSSAVGAYWKHCAPKIQTQNRKQFHAEEERKKKQPVVIDSSAQIMKIIPKHSYHVLFCFCFTI